MKKLLLTNVLACGALLALASCNSGSSEHNTTAKLNNLTTGASVSSVDATYTNGLGVSTTITLTSDMSTEDVFKKIYETNFAVYCACDYPVSFRTYSANSNYLKYTGLTDENRSIVGKETTGSTYLEESNYSNEYNGEYYYSDLTCYATSTLHFQDTYKDGEKEDDTHTYEMCYELGTSIYAVDGVINTYGGSVGFNTQELDFGFYGVYNAYDNERNADLNSYVKNHTTASYELYENYIVLKVKYNYSENFYILCDSEGKIDEDLAKKYEGSYTNYELWINPKNFKADYYLYDIYEHQQVTDEDVHQYTFDETTFDMVDAGATGIKITEDYWYESLKEYVAISSDGFDTKIANLKAKYATTNKE